MKGTRICWKISIETRKPKGQEDDAEEQIDVPAHKRRKGGRRPLPAFLPRVEVVHDLSEAEKVCPHDATHTLQRIGEEVSEQLDIIPAVLQVIRHVRPQYACGRCKEVCDKQCIDFDAESEVLDVSVGTIVSVGSIGSISTNWVAANS